MSNITHFPTFPDKGGVSYIPAFHVFEDIELGIILSKNLDYI